MVKIMSALQKYVPSTSENKTFVVDGEVTTVNDVTFWPILFGGDQLTAVRARGAQALRCTHDTSTDRIDGLFPVIEDWHARVTLAKVFILVHVSESNLVIWLLGSYR